jgi:hypothetical protein
MRQLRLASMIGFRRPRQYGREHWELPRRCGSGECSCSKQGCGGGAAARVRVRQSLCCVVACVCVQGDECVWLSSLACRNKRLQALQLPTGVRRQKHKSPPPPMAEGPTRKSPTQPTVQRRISGHMSNWLQSSMGQLKVTSSFFGWLVVWWWRAHARVGETRSSHSTPS